ncbi:MAG: single-stranded-DNA-specific exonuclease RecJ [Lachnospiraceae bacterium]|nr:single-stranded-DNA-specific exonuclease RecJ [Lachnospiraceae bacterium]
MEKWAICNKKGDFDGISRDFGISKVSARILVNRDICEYDQINEFLNPEISMLHSPIFLNGVSEAAVQLKKKIDEGKKIRIVGDYDVDGIMATYILTDAIRSCGGNADWYIPHRIRDGYGINPDIINTAVEDGIDTVITCDNGIAAFEAADEARKAGITMIITDHHELQDRLPDCDIIIDPKQKDDTYPCKEICGAVVAAKLAQILFETMGLGSKEDRYLEFMAMATICDVVSLRGENRVIAKLGIKKLTSTSNPGLAALIGEKNLDPDSLTEYHVGYVLGPCFNATGRIDDAGVALKMLMEKDPAAASDYARECVQLNEERKEMTAEQEKKAIELVDAFDVLPKVIVVELADCHESILGIIAGRLKEHYSRPAIAATRNSEGYKASARSTENYNIFEELKKCSDLLVKFGGHPMAAGLTIKADCFDEFAARMNDNCELGDEDLCRRVLIDAEVAFNAFDEKTMNELARFAPFGPGNPTALFAERDLRVKSISYIGKDNNFLKFILENSFGYSITATMFSDAEGVIGSLERKFGRDQVKKAFSGLKNEVSITAAYYPRVNVYRDVKDIQMNIRYIRI